MKVPFSFLLIFFISALVQADIIEDISFANEWSYFWNRNSLLGGTNQPCTTATILGTIEGICTSLGECLGRGRQSLDRGTCGFLQICCVDRRSCGRSTKSKVSTFVNPTNVNEIPSECEFRVTLMNPNICQIRIDINTSIAVPGDYPTSLTGNAGLCVNDFIEIENSALKKQLSNICGVNTNQHVYVHLSPNERHLIIRVIIADRTDNSVKMLPNPTWSLRITQLECPGRKTSLTTANKTQAAVDFPRLAPDNCLQYYTESTGTVKSFNYDGIKGYFRNNDYAMCFRRPRGSCGIKIEEGFLGTLPTEAPCGDFLEIPATGFQTGAATGITPMTAVEKCQTSGALEEAPWYSVHPGTLYLRFYSNGNADVGQGFTFKYNTNNNCIPLP